MGIDLDDLFKDNVVQIPEDDTGIKDLVHAKTRQVVKAKEETSTAKVLDRYKILMYAIDRSGSMGDILVGSSPDDYEWPANLISHMQRYLNLEYSLSEDEAALAKILQDDIIDTAELMAAIIQLNPVRFGIYPRRDTKRDSKMDMVKKSVKDLVDRRYEKYPDARVILMSFNQEADISAATHETIKAALDTFYPSGGTSIPRAVAEALAYFEKYPSPVGLYHLVVVSDGEDWSAMSIKEDYFPRMKELGVVLDYIYITSARTVTQSSVALMFKEICKELGGEYVEVVNAEEFKNKLLVASERLCLPPAMKEE